MCIDVLVFQINAFRIYRPYSTIAIQKVRSSAVTVPRVVSHILYDVIGIVHFCNGPVFKISPRGVPRFNNESWNAYPSTISQTRRTKLFDIRVGVWTCSVFIKDFMNGVSRGKDSSYKGIIASAASLNSSFSHFRAHNDSNIYPFEKRRTVSRAARCPPDRKRPQFFINSREERAQALR